MRPRPPVACLCGCLRLVTVRKGKYATQRCQREHDYQRYIAAWLRGEISGVNPNWGDVSGYVRRYILERDGNQCVLCGWGERNPHTGTLPLVLDHIDGDSENTTEGNLRTLCPNCDSLTNTYKGANRGRGRKGRMKRYLSVKLDP
jgi:hypothetical protein